MSAPTHASNDNSRAALPGATRFEGKAPVGGLEGYHPRPWREIGRLYASCAEELLNLANHQ
jgi:hypothetical protein